MDRERSVRGRALWAVRVVLAAAAAVMVGLAARAAGPAGRAGGAAPWGVAGGGSRLGPTFGAPLLNSGGAPGSPGDVIADIALGQIDLIHNMVNFGGPRALNLGAPCLGCGGWPEGIPLAGVAIDRSTTPNGVYVADTGNNRVLGWRDVTALTSGAPADVVIGQPDFYSYQCNEGAAPGDLNGLGPDSLCRPYGVAVDASGNLYVADPGNNRVLEYPSPLAAFTASGTISGLTAAVVFGQGGSGTDFTSNAYATSATALWSPTGVTVDASGNLYVADTGNNRVLEYNTPLVKTSASGSGDVTADLVFGQGGSGSDFASNACTSLPANATGLCGPEGVAVDSNGDLYIADWENNRVLEYNTPLVKTGTSGSGDVTADLVFGQGSSGTNFTTSTCYNGEVFSPTQYNPEPSATGLCEPKAVAVDGNGNLYVADTANSRVLEYATPVANASSPDVAVAASVFGQGSQGSDGTGAEFTTNTCLGGGGYGGGPNPLGATGLCGPSGIAVDSAGNLYVADTNNNRVLKYHAPLAVSPTNVTAGLALGQGDLNSDMLDLGGRRALLSPSGLAVDRSTTPNGVYVADEGNNRVLGWSDVAALANGAPADIVIGQPDFYSYNTDAGAAVAADNLDFYPPVFAGGYYASWACATLGVGPLLGGLAVDGAGNLYVADTCNNRVLEYSSPLAAFRTASKTVGLTADMAFGQGGGGNNFTSATCNNGMNGTAVSADGLCLPAGVAVDPAGNLYVADSGNNRVLEYNTPLTKTGVAGSGDVTADLVFGQSNATDFKDNVGGASATGLFKPAGVTLDASGNLYVADIGNSRVLEYNTPLADPSAPNVTANLVFGQGSTGTNFTTSVCSNGVGSDPAPSAIALCGPAGVALDGAGNLYVADGNNRVLAYATPLANPVAPNVTAGLVFGQGSSGTDFTASACLANGSAPAASVATMCLPVGVAVDSNGGLYVADSANNRVLIYLGPFIVPTPTPTPTATPTLTPTASPTPLPSFTATPRPFPSFTPIPFPTPRIRGGTPVPLPSFTPFPFPTPRIPPGPFPTPRLPQPSATPGIPPGRQAGHSGLPLLGGAGGASASRGLTPSSPVVVTLGVAGVSVGRAEAVFAPVAAGGSALQWIALENRGNALLSGTLEGFASDSPFSLVSGAGPFQLEPGAQLLLGVWFAPPYAGSFAETLAVTTAEGSASPLAISLTGVGR